MLENRVARRYLARDFSTPEALKEYLHEHPHADKSKHHVVKHDKKGPKDEGPKDEDHGAHEEKGGEHDDHEDHEDHDEGSMVSRLKGALKGLASKLKDSPAAVQKFVADPKHRKEAIGKGIDALKKTPKKYGQQLVKTAKHEVKEFKTAGQGIAAAMKGNKPSAEQKKAIKAVAIHMAITTAAAVLTVSSPALIAVAMGKAMGKHVALKAAVAVLGDLHVLEEMGHIGHGIQHALAHIKFATERQAEDEGGKLDPHDALAALVMKHVAKQLEEMDDDYLAEALGAEKGESKEAARVASLYLVTAEAQAWGRDMQRRIQAMESLTADDLHFRVR